MQDRSNSSRKDNSASIEESRLTLADMLKLQLADQQKEIPDLQIRVAELTTENQKLKRKATLLDDLVYDKLITK